MNSPSRRQQAMPGAEAPRRTPWPKIIGFVTAGIVFLFFAAMIIPCFVDSRSAANGSISVGSLHTIAAAQKAYSQDHPDKGFATTLSELGPVGGYLIDSTLASGYKSGYAFTLTPGAPDSSGRVTKYTVSANPQERGKTGTRSFFMDESGVVHATAENRPATASDPALQ